MNIAIDFDDTLTRAPELWKVFVDKAKELGHNLYCVTCRRHTDENCEIVDDWMDEHDIQIFTVFTNMRSKRQVMDERGIRIDIWIDDIPESVEHGR